MGKSYRNIMNTTCSDISSRSKYIDLSSRNILIFKIILFVFFPFGAFLYSLLNAKSTSSYIIFFLFGVVFCWHMNPTGNGNYDDLEGIMDRVIMTNISSTEMNDQIKKYFTLEDDAPKEIYENLLIFISKSISPNPHLYFAFASIIFLYFMLGSLKFITNDFKYANSISCIIILILFLLPRDIITVQNPRFGTGVWIVVYATISFFSYNKNRIRYLLLLMTSVFFHSAFWFYVISFFIALICMKHKRIMIILLYISLPFSFLSYDLLQSINLEIIPIPSSLLKWIQIYLSEDSYNTYIIKTQASGFFWVQQTFNFIRTFAYLLIPFILWKKQVEFKNDKLKYSLFLYFISFFTIVNFIQFIPVLGERFYWIIRILSIFLWFKIIYPRHRNILLFILFSFSYDILYIYFYKGAV